MRGSIEKLLHPSHPDFEKGDKTFLNIGARRFVHVPVISNHIPQLVDSFGGPFLSSETRRLKEKFFQHPHVSDPALRLIGKNLIFGRKEVFLRASPFHIDNWLRDSCITSLALNEVEIEKHLLDNFTKNIDAQHQHVPTTRLFVGNRKWFFDDESSALSIVWRAKIAGNGITLSAEEKTKWENVLDWVKSHVRDGYYVTSAGTGKSWFDTYQFSEDTITYNQGVYVVALLAAKRLGLSVDDGQFEKAKAAYNRLTHESGRLQLSKAIPHKDASALFGEFLCESLFDEPVLNSEIVHKTVNSLTRERYGFRVVEKEAGGFLDPVEFNKAYQGGDYHNGADWPFFSAMVQAVGCYHGLPLDQQLLIDRLKVLHESQNAEYFYTGRRSNNKVVYDHNPSNYAWNAAVYEISRKLLGDQGYEEILRPLRKSKGLIYASAAEMQDSSL